MKDCQCGCKLKMQWTYCPDCGVNIPKRELYVRAVEDLANRLYNIEEANITEIWYNDYYEIIALTEIKNHLNFKAISRDIQHMEKEVHEETGFDIGVYMEDPTARTYDYEEIKEEFPILIEKQNV